MRKVIIVFLMLQNITSFILAQPNGPMGVERIARLTPMGYMSGKAVSDEETKWVQVDLGFEQVIDSVKLYPLLTGFDHISSTGFPKRFRITVSNDSLQKRQIVVEDYNYARADFPDPYDAIQVFNAGGVRGRYVRLTAFFLRQNHLALSKFEVYSEGKDIAEGCPVSDMDSGYLGKNPLTRAPRPQGEGVITNNPGNVIPFEKWRPVSYKINYPATGVIINDGIFKTTMDNNIDYMLHTTVDHLTIPFYERARKEIPSDSLLKLHEFLDVGLAGSNAGRFLMGAGNTLMWMDVPELRKRMNQVIDAIDECRASWYYKCHFN